MARQRKDGDTRKVARLLNAGLYPRAIARALGWELNRVRWRVRFLVEDGAFVAIGNSGQYERGKNARRWLAESAQPSEQRGLPNPRSSPSDPGYRLITGARFKVRVTDSNGHRLSSYTLKNGVRVYQTRVRCRHKVRVSAQIYNDKTALLSLATFELAPEALPDANLLLFDIALDAVRRLSKNLGIGLAIPEPIPDPKADGGELPLVTGEIVKPLPGKERVRGRVRIADTSELNASPPGLAFETSDLAEAVVDATLPTRTMALEKSHLQVAQAIESLEGTQAQTVRMLEAIGNAIERLNTFLAGAEDRQPAGPGPEVR